MRRSLQARRAGSDLVRCDIGQIVGVRPEDEGLYGPPLGLEETRAAVADLGRERLPAVLQQAEGPRCLPEPSARLRDARPLW